MGYNRSNEHQRSAFVLSQGLLYQHEATTLGFNIIAELLFCGAWTVFYWRYMVCHWKRSTVYFLGFFFIGSAFWTQKYIGETTIDQLISTFIFGVNGVLSVNQELTESLIGFLLIFPCVMTLLGLSFDQWLTKQTVMPTLFRLVQKIAPTLLVAMGFLWIGNEYHVLDAFYALSHRPQKSSEDLFAKHYKSPADVAFQLPNPPKNLILIYVESLESTYQDATLFGRNLLAPLTDITPSSISFHQFEQTRGAEWTIAGMVASECGIPLKLISVFGRNIVGKNVSQFLPGAICLSDVLQQQGYENVFLNGPSLAFAGVANFLKTHHYKVILGKEEWLSKGFNAFDMFGWGFPDDLLFQQAKLKLNQLMSRKKPFNLTLLTIDTHGRLNKTCRARGATDFQGIVECTANEVADFIHYIDSQGWMERVVIVVTGDHLAMVNSVSNQLAASPSRYVFNLIINQRPLQKSRDTILHVDLFPTILNALGITWSGNQLALGYSAIAPASQPISSGEHFNTIEKIVASRSPTYDKLWLMP